MSMLKSIQAKLGRYTDVKIIRYISISTNGNRKENRWNTSHSTTSRHSFLFFLGIFFNFLPSRKKFWQTSFLRFRPTLLLSSFCALLAKNVHFNGLDCVWVAFISLRLNNGFALISRMQLGSFRKKMPRFPLNTSLNESIGWCYESLNYAPVFSKRWKKNSSVKST